MVWHEVELSAWVGATYQLECLSADGSVNGVHQRVQENIQEQNVLKEESCFPITLPQNDAFYSTISVPQTCLEFSRCPIFTTTVLFPILVLEIS